MHALDALRQATKDLHIRLEGQALSKAILNPAADADVFRSFLDASWQGFRTIEPAIGTHIDDELLAHRYAYRRQEPLLQHDRGIGIAETAGLRAAPRLAVSLNFLNRDEALGALYVLHGSLHGKQLIQKTLQRNGLGYLVSESLYLKPDRQAWDAWRSFCVALAEDLDSTPAIDAASKGGSKVFELFIEIWQAYSGTSDPTSLRV